jgi:hypothetical protein
MKLIAQALAATLLVSPVAAHAGSLLGDLGNALGIPLVESPDKPTSSGIPIRCLAAAAEGKTQYIHCRRGTMILELLKVTLCGWSEVDKKPVMGLKTSLLPSQASAFDPSECDLQQHLDWEWDYIQSVKADLAKKK